MIEREEIYQRVWGYAMAHGDRSVDVFVRKLRAKLERRRPAGSYIHTHFGVGYRFEPETITPGAATCPSSRPASRARRGRRRRRHTAPRCDSHERAFVAAWPLGPSPVHSLFTTGPRAHNKLPAGQWEPAL